jgi:membrane protein
MLSALWRLIKISVLGFIEDDTLSHGAAMAFYAATSLAPILLIVIAVAGLAFGRDAAQNAVVGQLSGLLGPESAKTLQTAIISASGKSAGVWATLLGGVTLLITASGVFGEMQASLNVIWKAKPKGGTISRLLRARGELRASGGIRFSPDRLSGVSAALTALGGLINMHLPFGAALLSTLNGAISFALLTLLFAAIYKVLPDRPLHWKDVWVGATVTAALFTIGKSLIGWYIGSSAVASSYGAAGALIVVLLWVYYSSQVFLLGAEFTRAYESTHVPEPAACATVRHATSNSRTASEGAPSDRL